MFLTEDIKTTYCRGTWVAQSVEQSTIDFGPGHNHRVVGLSPMSSSVLSMESAWDIFSLSLSLCPPLLSLSLSLKLKKKIEEDESKVREERKRYAAGCEDGNGHDPRKVGSLQKLKPVEHHSAADPGLLDFGPPGLQDNHCVLFQATELAGVCYSSHTKLTHLVLE